MPKLKEQIAFPLDFSSSLPERTKPLREHLRALLSGDLDFHADYSSYAAHNFHAFPAKFPPQLPRLFIQHLTHPGDIVLDPMMGSGTTILEAYLTDRQAIGLDIDPLALLISKTKVTPLDTEQVEKCAYQVLSSAREQMASCRPAVEQARLERWDQKSLEFIDYWFSYDNQLELIALINSIEKVVDPAIQAFLKLSFSAIIITKSGGGAMALDLAHTRPHRAKVVLDQKGQEILREVGDKASKHLALHTKNLRSPLTEFERRYKNNLKDISPSSQKMAAPFLSWGDAQQMPVSDDHVDLIVTSPPYASNAIDYMRAHKFSLVWLKYPLEDLSHKRQAYIGGETLSGIDLVSLPPGAWKIVDQLNRLDAKKGAALHRYYSEMTRVLREMHRVLKPGKAAIVVVGSSIIRGIDTETQHCLAEIGCAIGFDVLEIGVRNLERNRRMLPAGARVNRDSQIQQRMHEEYVIGFLKPER